MKKYLMIFFLSSGAFAKDVEKIWWVGFAPGFMAQNFCKAENQPLRCYDVTEKQCSDAFTELTKMCIRPQEVALPDKFDGSKVQALTEGLAFCTGRGYRLMFNDKRSNKKGCDNF